MSRTKQKEGKSKLFYLENETIEEIRRCATLINLSDSSYIDFIIKREKLNRNPIFKIKDIQLKKQELQLKIQEMEKQEKQAVEEADKLHNWQEAKRIKKPQAIKILQQKILNNELEEAEEIAKTWSKLTGISPIELLLEAKDKIDKSGI